ncbi:MAG: tetratricopeptide repeat protein [Spirochaetes bacterium]|nr:tetratricopeptide repeat protein [Spirochaetota bacterium]
MKTGNTSGSLYYYIIIFFLIITTGIHSLYAYYDDPDKISLGWGVVADVSGPASIGVNPAGIGDSNPSFFSVTMRNPFVFHNVNVLFKLPKKVGLGFSALQINEFHTFETALGLRISEYFNFGFNFALQREYPDEETEESDLSISTGLQIKFKKYSTLSPWGISMGLFLRNQKTIENLKIYTNFTKLSFDYGIMVNALQKNLKLHLGGNYYDEDSNFSVSISHGVEIANFRLGFNTADQILYGLKLGKSTGNIAFGGSRNYEEDINYFTLSYTKAFWWSSEALQDKKKALSGKDLSRQKDLIDKGLIYYRDKDYKKAKQLFQQAIWIAPNSKYGKEANDYLKRVNRILQEID